jgi:hypothetical protein
MEMGRPTVFDETTLQKLEGAFANDATDEQACFIANISPSSLYNYQKEHPDFLERKKALKDMIKYQAKLRVKEAIEKEDRPDTSKWYLERKDNEFKNKTDITSNDESLQPILVKFIDKNENNHDTNGIQKVV